MIHKYSPIFLSLIRHQLRSYDEILVVLDPKTLVTIKEYLDHKLENENCSTSNPSASDLLKSQGIQTSCVTRACLQENAAHIQRVQLQIEHEARAARKNLSRAVHELL